MNFDVLPSNLDEAIDILLVFYKGVIPQIKTMSEKEFVSSSHFTGGMFIRNSWQLWWYENHKYEQWSKTKPLLNQQFNDMGIVHADDMSGIIVTCLYRKIHNLDYDLPTQIKKYQDHWKQQGFPDGIPKH